MAEELKFEQSLEQLEKLVQDLEGGDLDLDEALKRFEKGVKLSKQLNQSLEEANRKVEKLVIRVDGGAELESFEAGTPAPPKKSRAKKAKDQENLF
jgi:exodeoxyribonuclease VII small subunit